MSEGPVVPLPLGPRRFARRRLLPAALVALLGSAALAPAVGAQTPGQGTVERDVEYAVADGESLRMDVYIPPGEGPFPAIEVIHGGGWALGDKEDVAGLAGKIVARGFVAFAIDYRLAPASCYPAQVDDARAAVAFVRENATQFGVDPERIGTLGTSAGGTLAAMVSLLGDGPLDQGSRVAAGASWSGALDLAGVAKDRLGSDLVQTRLRDYLCLGAEDLETATARDRLRVASASTYVSCGDSPMFVANATEELMPLPQAQEFVAKLQSTQVPVAFLNPPTGHASDYAAEATEPTLEFFDTYVRDFVPSEAGCGGGLPIVPLAAAAVGLAILGTGVGAAIAARRRRHMG